MKGDRQSRLLFRILVAGAFAWGIWRAWSLRWVCDDIFVTFRYIQNFLEGNGLVFNPGEYVEGYTHFLWLWLITLFEWMGFNPVPVSMILGVVAYGGVLLLSAGMSRGSARPGPAWIPFTPMALALSFDAEVWATSGLETMFYTLCLVAAFWVFYFTSLSRRRRLFLSGLLLIAATLTRPDGALLYLFAVLCLLVDAWARRRGARDLTLDLAAFGAAFLFLYVPVAAWKVYYYGSLVPNTYYAKAAYLSDYGQGFYYLGLFVWVYPSVVLALGALIAVAWRLGKGWKSAGARAALVRLTRSRPRTAACVAVCGVVLYAVFFIARVGGDFMFGRFMVPMLPFLYYSLEWLGRFLFRSHPRRAAAVLAALCVVVGLESARRVEFFRPADGSAATVDYRGITDEHAYYTEKSVDHGKMTLIELYRRVGLQLAPEFSGLNAVVLANTQYALAYYGKFKTVIGFFGLTDATIAHQPIDPKTRAERRPGHIQIPSTEYLAERGTDIMILRRTPGLPDYQMAQLTLPDGMTAPAVLITYNKKFLAALKGRMGKRFQFVDFERYLDRYVKDELPKRSRRQVEEDYRRFFTYYFYGNPGTWWEQAIRERLKTR